jgi:hypothetical protein
MAGLLLASVLCTPVQAGFFKKTTPEPIPGKVIFSENFDDSIPTDVPVRSLVVGPATFYSDKPSLGIVSVGIGDRAISVIGTYLRFGINPINLGQGQALQLQFNITYPNGATDDKQSLRFGLSNLSDTTETNTIVAGDQGLSVFTVPSVDARLGKTSIIQDLNIADRSGKWPGFLGGGPGSRQNAEKCGSINFQNKTALIIMTIAPVASQAAANMPWQVSFSIKVGKKSITNRYIFDSSSQFDLTSFNTVGIRIGSNELAYIDNIAVSLIKIADTN